MKYNVGDLVMYHPYGIEDAVIMLVLDVGCDYSYKVNVLAFTKQRSSIFGSRTGRRVLTAISTIDTKSTLIA
jgi:hypothetical protein